ncbi:shikimate dehydrogenase [Bacillus dakarensis]|uniref:shikimate dehydrogenase n=1 Tax=Robertmurraya dakarensis TaxID=1926278 RepID=UPI00098239B6|nr:shikimate dehydrogenase [Bacillus dakarensis]
MKKLYAVIGDPIAHSMSPLMHNDLFQFYGIDAHYQALQVKEQALADAVRGLKAINISGFNITIPHKVAVMPLLDEIDPLAQAIGAVNTVVNKEGNLIGYNTDGSGYVRGLQNYLADLQDKKVLIIGAGGAARAIYFTMAHEGVKHIDLANRTAEKAASLAHDCPYDVITKALTLSEAEDNLASYDLIIQTTSIGMVPKTECEPISLHNLRETAFVSDIIYNPFETLFLKNSRLKGAGTQNGLDMFVLQGALAFEKWTGIFPDTERMKKIVEKQLGGA